jgi:phenylpropionate dioxygenase-like ring-hydroxylating dioxygenase large terminal subunit
MFKNFWYACELGSALTEKPKRVRALGQDLALYRTRAGKAVALSDLCIHRGGSLSMGHVQDDCVRCPYHGWKFDESGKCVEIPANGPGKAVPQRARVDAYPTEERYGLVWVFLGDLPEAERPPIPVFEEFEDPEFYPLWGIFDWKANYERVIENGIDIAHAPWVHKNTFGNVERPTVDDYEVEAQEWGFKARIPLASPRRNIFGKQTGTKVVHTAVGVHLPHVTTLDLDLPNGFKMRLFDANLPVDEHHTRTFWIMLRNFFPYRWADPMSRRSVTKIFLEDQPFVEAQRPELGPDELSAELHVKADAAQLAYRKLRQEAIDRGLMLKPRRDPSRAERVELIASPARRKESARTLWVFDERAVKRARDAAE